MTDNTHNTVTQENTELDPVEVIATATTVYNVPEGDALSRLTVINTIRQDIEATEADDYATAEEAKARSARLVSKKDAAVMAVAELLTSLPSRVVQAKLHAVYGGKLSQGKPSKTIPAGDGDAFLKAAKAYNAAITFIETGAVPESWSQGKSLRGEIAAMLDDSDKAALRDEIENKSKIAVSDTITRFFRDLTPKAAPLHLNAEKLNELAENILVNAEYISQSPELRIAYATIVEAFRSLPAE